MFNSCSLTAFQLKMLNKEVDHWFIHFFSSYSVHSYFSNEEKEHVAVKSALFSCLVLSALHPGTLVMYKVIALILSLGVVICYPFPKHDGQIFQDKNFKEKCKIVAVCLLHVSVDVVVHVELGDPLVKAFGIALLYFTLGFFWEMFVENRYLKPGTVFVHICWVACYNYLPYYYD